MFNKNVSYINRKKLKKAVELPSELVEQILSWLPSKSLLRCRSVCKSWLSLISSSQFILMHLHNFNQPTSRRYLVRRLFYRREKCAVHFDDQQFTLDTNSPIPFPYNFNLSGTEILFFRLIGCYNGVICFSSDTIGRDEIILWNPSIRKILTVLPSMFRTSVSPVSRIHLGFAYHEMSDDYKIIRLADHRSITTFQVQIYSVKNAIWRALEFPPHLPSNIFSECSQVFLNGAVHWIAYDYIISSYSILTFDMNTELFGEIGFPDESLQHVYLKKLRLAVVGDSLAIIYSKSSTKLWWSDSTYKIWAMKEYKNPMSWTMIYNVYYPNVALGRALGVTSNADLITVGSTEGDVTICNPDEWYSVYGSRSEGIHDSEYSFVERYQESLALLDVGSDYKDEKELDAW